jgi:hypothetical protein
VVYLTPKIERIISLLSASPVGEARLPMPKGIDDEFFWLVSTDAQLVCIAALLVHCYMRSLQTSNDSSSSSNHQIKP